MYNSVSLNSYGKKTPQAVYIDYKYTSIDDVVASLTARPPNPLLISVCLLPDLIESTFTVAHSLKIRHSQNGHTLAVGN